MKNDYEYYLNKINKLRVREMAEKSKVSEQLIRKYKQGHNLPQLNTAVLLFNNFGIDCEFWVIHNKLWKEKNKK